MNFFTSGLLNPFALFLRFAALLGISAKKPLCLTRIFHPCYFTGPVRSFNLPGPATFTLLFLSTIATSDSANSRAGPACFLRTSETQRRKGERIHTPPVSLHEPSWLVFISTLGLNAQRRRGERMSFYTYRGLATVVFELGLLSRERFKPSEEGERE